MAICHSVVVSFLSPSLLFLGGFHSFSISTAVNSHIRGFVIVDNTYLPRSGPSSIKKGIKIHLTGLTDGTIYLHVLRQSKVQQFKTVPGTSVDAVKWCVYLSFFTQFIL